GVWTYPLEDVWTGIQAAYQQISQEIATKFEIPLTTVGSIGFSAMMHGYLPFDSKGNLLTPFRTWRNTNTKMAAERLTELFQFKSEEHTSELQSRFDIVCRLLLEKKKIEYKNSLLQY